MSQFLFKLSKQVTKIGAAAILLFMVSIPQAVQSLAGPNRWLLKAWQPIA